MKTVSSSADTSIDGLYRIATVSHLTGIPVQTIRVWETRHSVVQPTRSGTNVRLYRRADIDRLSLVKAAVDAGQAIGTLAALTDRQIKARFKDAPTTAAKARKAGCRVLVVGSALASVLKRRGRRGLMCGFRRACQRLPISMPKPSPGRCPWLMP